MAVLPIRMEGDPVLRLKATPVNKVTRRIVRLLLDMEDTMYEANGVGLAAPQVGVSERLIVVDVGDGPFHFINPVITHAEGSVVDVEGCLSIPGVYGYVDRWQKIVVEALDIKGRPTRLEATDWLARALQHEVDHLDGVLFTDKATGLVDDTEDDNAALSADTPLPEIREEAGDSR